MNKLMLKKKYMMYAPKKKGRLPSEYQEVEYIQGTGTQCIDTGLLATNANRFELDFSLQEKVNTRLYGMFGGYAFGLNGANTFWGCGGDLTLGDIFTLNERYILKQDTRTNQATLNIETYNGINIGNWSQQYSSMAIDVNVYILDMKVSWSTIFAPAKAKVYGCKIHNGDTLVRDFIPCYRKSDNEVGLYDIVNNQFYTNQGSGKFLCGIEIIRDSISGFKQLDYIGGSGAYIVFPYETNGQNVGFDIEFDVPQTSLSSDTPIIQNDDWNNWVPLGMSLTNKNKTYFGNYRTTLPPYWTNDTYTYNENRYQINYLNSNKIKSIDKSNWEYSLSKDLTNVAISNFTIMSENVPSSFHLFYLTISDGENNIAKLIPMEETDSGLVGLYDIIGKRFYSSETSTNFTKGNYI